MIAVVYRTEGTPRMLIKEDDLRVPKGCDTLCERSAVMVIQALDSRTISKCAIFKKQRRQRNLI